MRNKAKQTKRGNPTLPLFVSHSALHEFQNLHAENKEKIHDFVRGHFYGYFILWKNVLGRRKYNSPKTPSDLSHYDFDLDNTMYFFTAGRYEYRNKGIDVFIEALQRQNSFYGLFIIFNVLLTFHWSSGLNQKLKHYTSATSVVGFFIASAKTKSFNVDALKGQAVVKQLRDTVEDIQKQIGIRIFEQAAR